MRIKAASSEVKAKLLMISIIPICFVYLLIIIIIGFVAFAYFQKCGDPFTNGLIKNQNQLLTQFLIQFLSDFHGLTGLFIGILISSSIGILSNVLKALAITLTHDFLNKNCFNLDLGRTEAINEREIYKEYAYNEELINLKTEKKPAKSEARSKSYYQTVKFCKKKVKKISEELETCVIIFSALLVIIFAVLFEFIPGSLTSMAMSITNSIHGSVIFIYLCAKFNDYKNKKNKINNLNAKVFKFKATDVIISCICSILFINFVYIGRLVTMQYARKFYNFERNEVILTKPTTNVEMEQFCHYEIKNFTQTLPSLAFQSNLNNISVIFKQQNLHEKKEISILNYFFGISFNWYSCIGFFICVLVMFIISSFRLIFAYFGSLLNNLKS